MVAVLGQCPARVYPEDALVGILPRRLFFFCCTNVFDVSQSFVQACAVAAVEDHLMVMSFGQSVVWLSFLACTVLAVSWTPDSC